MITGMCSSELWVCWSHDVIALSFSGVLYFWVFSLHVSSIRDPTTIDTSITITFSDLWMSRSGFMKVFAVGIMGSTQTLEALPLSMDSNLLTTLLCLAHLASWVTSHLCCMWLSVSLTWQAPLHIMSSVLDSLPLARLAFVDSTPPLSCIPRRCNRGNNLSVFYSYRWLAASTSVIVISFPSTDWASCLAHISRASFTMVICFATHSTRPVHSFQGFLERWHFRQCPLDRIWTW